MTLYKDLFSKQPALDYLQRVGCVAFKRIPEQQRSEGKFGAGSGRCMMLGYVHDISKIWRLWDFEQNRLVVQSADVYIL
jgi:hypothetical protein